EIEAKARDLFLREGEVNAIENALKNVLGIEENNNDIKEKLAAHDKEIEKIRQEKAGLETKLTEKSAEITDLTEKITATEAEFTQKSKELNEIRAEKNDVEKAYNEAKRKISAAEKECEALKDELTREQSVHKNFQDAKAAKTQAESERNAYRESQNTTQQEKDKVLANLNKEQKQHRNTKDQLAIVSQAKEKVEKTLVAEKVAHTITAAAKNETESKLNNKIDDLEKTDEQLRNEQKKVQSLQAKCRKLRQEKSTQQEQENEILIRLNTDLHHQLETALKNYQQTKNDLQTEQTSNQKLSQDLEKELFNQKRQAEILKNNTLRSLADLQNENQQFRQTIDQKTTECDTTQQERDREVRKTSLLKKATKSLRDKLSRQTNNLVGLLSAANNAIRNYEKYLKEELKISDLNNLPSVPAPLATLINFFNNPPNCLNPQHSDYDSLKSRLRQAETECDRLAAENQKLKNQNDPARNDNPQKRSGSQPTENKSPADSQLVNELRNQIMTLNQKIRQGESINEKELLSRINSDLSLDLSPPINYDQVITAIQQLIKNNSTESYNQELASGSDKVNKNLIP
ncbi:9096_t:CDS:2, partial [Cetraspora pellucida]